jgi:hypothetical protein
MGSIAAAGLVMLAVVATGSASPAQVLKRRVDTGMAFDDFAPGVEFSYEQVRNPR